MSRMLRCIASILPLVGFITVVVIVLGNTLWPPNGQMIAGDDTAHFFYFFKQYTNRAFSQGYIPWWNPYIFSGTPYASVWSAGLLYPLNWIFFSLLPLPIGFSWHIGFHLVIAMVGMYWLCRLWTDRMSSSIAGIVFGLSGIVTAAIFAGHNDGIATFSYIPIVFRLFWVGMRQGKAKQIAVGGLVAALQYTSGYPVITMFLVEIIGIAAVTISLDKKSVKPLMRYVLMWIIAFGIVSVGWLPNQELLSHSVRTFSLPYGWVSKGALEIKYLWELVNPYQYGDQNGYYGPWQFYHERILFFGRLPLLLVITLGIWAIVKRTKRIEIWVLFCIALFGLWISFAQFAPFDLNHLFWQYVPVYQKLRIPTRHVILFIFAVSALTGIGVSLLRPVWTKVIVLMVVLVELIPFARHFVSLAALPENRQDKQLISYLTNEKGLYREVNNFNAGLPIRDALDFNAGTLYGYYSSTGYDTAMLRNYYEFIDASVGHTGPGITDNDIQVPYLDLQSAYVNYLNIKYIFTPIFMDTIQANPTSRYSILKEKPGEWRFYQNNDVLPRYFIVGTMQIFNNRDTVVSVIRNNTHDLSKIVLFEAKNVPNRAQYQLNCSKSLYTPTIQTYLPGSISMNIDLPCNGFLVSSDVMYPGWEAYIDGKRTTILEGNLAFRTIYVPVGRHRIEFRFVPYSVYVGALLSVLTSIGLYGWLYYFRKRKTH